MREKDSDGRVMKVKEGGNEAGNPSIWDGRIVGGL